MRYAHLRPEYLKEAVNRGSLAKTEFGTGSKTGSKENHCEEETSQHIEKEWLGDEGSNLDRQIQSLSSCH